MAIIPITTNVRLTKKQSKLFVQFMIVCIAGLLTITIIFLTFLIAIKVAKSLGWI